MTHDARVSAWPCAWKRLEALAEIAQHSRTPANPAAVKRVLTEARIYADLACAPEDVGVGAGEVLHEEHAQKQFRKQWNDDRLRRFSEVRDQ